MDSPPPPPGFSRASTSASSPYPPPPPLIGGLPLEAFPWDGFTRTIQSLVNLQQKPTVAYDSNEKAVSLTSHTSTMWDNREYIRGIVPLRQRLPAQAHTPISETAACFDKVSRMWEDLRDETAKLRVWLERTEKVRADIEAAEEAEKARKRQAT